MTGIFQGLEAGKRALMAQQYALTTAGHNIANANTPGFSRQRVQLVASDPLVAPQGRFGTGVRIANVRSVRDAFLTGQYRQGNGQLGRWTQLERAMSEVENIFLEPLDNGFNAVMNDFFAAWQTLSQNPESSAARAAVREQAALVVNAFHQLSSRLSDLERSLDLEVAGRVGSINRIAADLADLNREIARQELGGEHANDLRDRRDLLIDELSQYADVRVIELPNGAARVFLGAMELVERASFSPISTTTSVSGSIIRTTAVWKGTQIPVTFSGGELAGLAEARDDLVPQYRGRLDELVAAFVTEVNGLHSGGYALDGTTGHNFFDPSRLTAADVALDPAILANLNLIAASQSGGPGDNAIAVSIANLQNALTMNTSTATFNEFFAEIVGTVGVRAAEANDAKTNSDLILQQIESSRQSVQGVSLDEEMANLIKSQHAYDAAARIVTVMDRALDTLINDMGVGV